MNLKNYLAWNRAFALALLVLADPDALQAQRAAKAVADVGAHGAVTNIVVTDGGQGYTRPPGIAIGGGGGSGAAALAVVSNGAVSSIQVLSGGAGYGKPPALGIAPPDMTISVLGLRRGAQVTLMGELGSTQELQRLDAFDGSRNWTSLGSVVLTNSTWSFSDTNASATGQRYYRAVARGPERPAAPQDMVWLPPGSFLMGSPLSDPDYIANEGPQTEVRLTQGFFLGRKEVSQGEYWSLMGTNPATFTGDTNQPVETVSWAEAAAYCAKLTQRDQSAGRIPATWRYRLPREAEWEYAARAGSPDRFSFGEAEAGENSWLADNNQGMTHPVGLLRPNAWGIYDLAGNVAEWGMDVYGDYPGSRMLDPMGAIAGLFRVVRGGSGAAPLAFCRAGARDARSGVDYRDAWLGFRVALSCARPEPEVQKTAVGGAISGTVLFKDSRLPVAGVAVYLCDTNFPADTNNLQNNRPGFIAATLTGQDGRYCFSNVKPGGYAVVPMKSADGLSWPMEPEGQSGSPLLVSSQDQQTADFSTQDPSLFELEKMQYMVEIYFNTNQFTNTWKLSIERRSFWLFGYFIYWQPIPEQQYELDARHVVHGLARIRMTSTYGYNIGFYGLENAYVMYLGPDPRFPPYRVGHIEFPITGCPEYSVFSWDLVANCVRRPSLDTPAAAPAGQVQFPGRFNASWPAVLGAEGYVVEVSADGTFTENDGQPTASIDAGATNQCSVQWAATNASAQRPYYYRVIAYNSNVFSSSSQAMRIGLDAVAAPAVQPATQATVAGFTANWSPLPGAQGYRLDVSTNADFGVCFVQNQDVGNATSFSVTNLPAGGGRFFFRVRAVAGNVVSPDSAVSSAMLPGLAWIPPGAFVMGSPDGEPERFSNEGPPTTVTLTRGFWMSRYEIMQREYLAVLGGNPSYCSGDLDRPVESVSWSEAKDYCAGLTAQERRAGRLPAGYVYRLPTEAEWEYACRAGTTNRFSHGDDPDYSGLAQYAWYGRLGGNTTHPVGEKRPNAWGLYDMHGNVGEWCLDWDGAYRGGSVTDPAPSAGSGPVARGGGWQYPGRSCRSAFRDGFYPGFKSDYLGFRPVLAPE